jgi:two-component system, chemotaxis family, CheB/CheR fusion protein
MSTQERDPAFEELLSFIKDERGFDFTGYKRPSLMRRIGKRMQEIGDSSYSDYQDRLQADPAEFVQLFNTILINVTAFFRDEVAWDYLKNEIVPAILEQHDGVDAPIRLWSTGCATGEEAFSLAMMFAEAVGEDVFKERVKIYATDVDDDALSHGRHAEYTAKQVEPVPADLLERYFEERDGNYSFRSDLRRTVIFGRHDLVQDPPISRISLLLSRNTLMYFDGATQRRILASFHFALRNGGYLFLGKSEALAARTDMFVPVDLKRRIFMKAARDVAPRLRAAPPQADALEQLAADALIRDAGFEAVPVAQLVVDRGGDLTLANLQARAFFGLTPRDIGRPFKDLEVSFRPVELRSRIEQVYTDRHIISLRDVEWRAGNEARYLDVQIAPLVASTGAVVGAGITFTEVTRYRRLQQALEESKRDIETAYEELQSTVEELETTNEELQSTNEELETTNEELQSTNEELETMNEELQSTNEELETMNDELNDRSLELNDANAFLYAVLGSLQAGVVVVDKELVITAWNDAARELWGLAPDEVIGKHLFNLDIGLPLDELRAPLRDTISTVSQQQVAVEAVNRRGRRITARISLMPLVADQGDARGAIMLMQDGPVDGDGDGAAS